MAGGIGTHRDDTGLIVLDEEMSERLASRMARRFHEVGQRLKGGTLQNAEGKPGPDPAVANQWGGKGTIKFNPTEAEMNAGIREQQSLLVWTSPDGLPKYVTVEVGRLASGVGGPGADGTVGGLTYVDLVVKQGVGSVGGASWPAATDASGNPLYYRAVAQVVVGTPGTMQDQFWIDVNRGQRFTAVASYVAVTAQMLGPPLDNTSGDVIVPTGFNGQPYRSGSLVTYATLGAAVAPSLAPVLYTQYIDNSPGLSPGISSYTRLIPPRANFIYPLFPSNLGTMSFQFFDNSGRAIEGQIFVAGETTQAPPYRIPADAYGVTFTDAVRPIEFRLVYQLSM